MSISALALVLAAQLAPRAPVVDVPIGVPICNRDGWCAELPFPGRVTAAATTPSHVLVVGTEAGILAIAGVSDGAFLAGTPTDLGPITHLAFPQRDVAQPGAYDAVACDSARCLLFRLNSSNLFDAVAGGEPARPAPPTSKLGEWSVAAGVVSRGKERFKLECAACNGHGKPMIFGAAHAPFVMEEHFGGVSVHGFDPARQRFVPHVLPSLFPYKSRVDVVVGRGCAPCLVARDSIALRTERGWRQVPFPASDSDVHVDGAAMSDAGEPIVRMSLNLDPPRTYAFDGARWVSSTAPTEPLPGDARERGWAARAGDEKCTATTSWGDTWRWSPDKPSVRTGAREERLLQRAGCFAYPGADGMLLMEKEARVSVQSRRWEYLGDTIGAPLAKPGTYRVVDVAAADVLFVRQGPAPSAAVSERLPNGECVYAYREASGRGARWLRVRYTLPGWANARYLRAEACEPPRRPPEQ